ELLIGLSGCSAGALTCRSVLGEQADFLSQTSRVTDRELPATLMLRNRLSNFAFSGPDKQASSCDCRDTVPFARYDQARSRVTQRDQMHVCGGQRFNQPFGRLKRLKNVIGNPALRNFVTQRPILRTASDAEKSDVWIIYQQAGSVEHGVELVSTA